jgi:hypothetical protein
VERRLTATAPDDARSLESGHPGVSGSGGNRLEARHRHVAVDDQDALTRTDPVDQRAEAVLQLGNCSYLDRAILAFLTRPLGLLGANP